MTGPPATRPDGGSPAGGPRDPVSGWMQPLRGAVPAFATAESARRRLEQEALRFLVVVTPGTGRLLGAVDRESLAARPCCERLGGGCTVVQHLAPGVDFCFHHEDAGEVAADEAELAAESQAPAVRKIPLLVVDNDLRPLGCLPVAETDRGVSSPAAPRAA